MPVRNGPPKKQDSWIAIIALLVIVLGIYAYVSSMHGDQAPTSTPATNQQTRPATSTSATEAAAIQQHLTIPARHGYKTIFEAVQGGDIMAIRWFLANGTRINDRGKNAAEPEPDDVAGFTPLMWAAEMGQEGVIDELLSRHADPNKPDPRGQTALMIASGRCSKAAVEKLVAAGARLNAVSQMGFSAVNYAHNNHHQDTEDFLISKGGRNAYADAHRNDP
jgi:ankyrin repeat protein